MKIQQDILINAPLVKVYQAFHNFDHWLKVLSDIVNIELFYDDGLHQEFSMTVIRLDRNETVRGMRFCVPYVTIEIFQTQPPEFFKSMSGSWNFYEEKNCIHVLAERIFEPKDSKIIGISSKKIKINLAAYLLRNLQCFKKYIEAGYVN